MAIWRVASTREGLRVSYRNRGTKHVFVCGLVRHDTPVELLVEWVLKQDAASPWDWISLPDGGVLQFLPQARDRQ